ncbi:site-specific integrase [Runella zeae]|uniref:site-specific integrase n=1 Tax=Runella zeae TaxID=94255 RepID=UPI00040B9C98|nr:site-specific integrase [Runella zeae]
MGKVTFHFELNSRPGADGKHSIMLRITHNKKPKRINIGYSVKKEDWNAEKEEVRKSHSLYAQINMAMKVKLLEAEKEYLKRFAENSPLSAGEIQRKLKKEVLGESYLDYADQHVGKVPNPETQAARESIVSKLKQYLGKGRDGRQKDLYFSEITYDFLKDYERHLTRLGNSANTIGANMKVLKTIYREAVKSKRYRLTDGSPWDEYAPPRKTKTKRTRLKAFEIEAIEKLEVPPNTRRADAKYMFLFSFYMQGIRVKDLLQLTWKDVKGNYLYYSANKTDKGRGRKIISKAQAILDLYKPIPPLKPKPNDYIFPLLKNVDKKQFDPRKWVKFLDSKNSLLRNELNEIAEQIGTEKLSMHVARHSFANIARQLIGDIHIISDALDHSSISITEQYFNDAEPEENDELVKRVFGE